MRRALLSLLTTLQPGDRLQLAAGTYTQQLRISNRNGAPGRAGSTSSTTRWWRRARES